MFDVCNKIATPRGRCKGLSICNVIIDLHYYKLIKMKIFLDNYVNRSTDTKMHIAICRATIILKVQNK